MDQHSFTAPDPDRSDGWTEWDFSDGDYTVAVTDNYNVAVIDNNDPDTAVFLHFQEATQLAEILLAASALAERNSDRDTEESGQ